MMLTENGCRDYSCFSNFNFYLKCISSNPIVYSDLVGIGLFTQCPVQFLTLMATSNKLMIVKDLECLKVENTISKESFVLYVVDEKKNTVISTSDPLDGTASIKKNATAPDAMGGYSKRGEMETANYQQQQGVGGQRVYVERNQPVHAASTSPYRIRNPFDDRFDPDNVIFNELFNERRIRNKFIQRVYTILTVQLLYTFGFIALCIFEPHVKKFVLHSLFCLILASVMQMTVFLSLVCCMFTRRVFPLNFILLAVFTISFAYLMGATSALKSTEIVMTSMGITAGVCLLISLFACQTSFDMTSCGVYLFIFSLVLTLFGISTIIVMLIMGPNKILMLVYSALIALFFSLYLMFDTQMIIGGRRVELSPEEYIFGALTLYVDIMHIFWAILEIFNDCDR